MNAMPDMFDETDLSEIFKDLAEQEYADVLKSGRRVIISPKNILFHQGDPAVNVVLVNRGRLKLTKLNDQGKEVILRYISTGELTAAVAVLKNWDYPVTAEAIENTEVTLWDKPTILQLMQKYPAVTTNLLNTILERIDDLQNRYLEMCTEHVNQRIARTLLRIMRRAGTRTRSGIQIDMPLSRQNIADYAGTTLYTVSRTLSAWEKKGWIKSGREQIIITDPHSLNKFAEIG